MNRLKVKAIGSTASGSGNGDAPEIKARRADYEQTCSVMGQTFRLNSGRGCVDIESFDSGEDHVIKGLHGHFAALFEVLDWADPRFVPLYAELRLLVNQQTMEREAQLPQAA